MIGARSLSRRGLMSRKRLSAILLIGAGTLGPGVSFARGSAGYFTNGAGVIASVGNDVPRFHGATQRLLIEGARTNVVTPSYGVGTTGMWSGNGYPTITGNAASAPDGTATATQIDTSGYNSGIFALNIASPDGLKTTLSIYLRNLSGATGVKIGDDNNYARFDLTNGTTSALNGSAEAATVEAVGYGWNRYAVTFNTGANGYPIVIYNQSGSAMSFLAWGVQSEQGNFVTSYIPTPANSWMSRAQDLMTFNLTTAQGLNGTLVGSAYALRADANDGLFRNLFSISEQGGQEIYAALTPGGAINFGRGINGNYGDVGTRPWSSNVLHKFALGYSPGGASLSIDGAAVVSFSDGFTGSYTRFALGRSPGDGNPFNGEFGQMSLYASRLTDAQLITAAT